MTPRVQSALADPGDDPSPPRPIIQFRPQIEPIHRRRTSAPMFRQRERVAAAEKAKAWRNWLRAKGLDALAPLRNRTAEGGRP